METLIASLQQLE